MAYLGIYIYKYSILCNFHHPTEIITNVNSEISGQKIYNIGVKEIVIINL